MSKNKNPIELGSRVLLHLSMTLEDGTEVISTYEDDPLSFTFGDGVMETSLEGLLLGLKTGDEQNWEVMGDEVYGHNDIDNLQWIDREMFSAQMELSIDQIIGFTTSNGEEVAGRIVKIEPAQIQLDFNHPLSGKIFFFKTTILNVDPPE
ncbi:MAG: FKBP-type peptidyl-prolyl cis-trans isomerase [Candidatus Thiodiazotropha sp. (ex Monitilora ramsayi)]|nr:FKBP-type peptidyl-prolyl cis-trans isomerase [Candidatus Thiodiazotropha sp. (ex Monitilora ramsayi)]